MKNFLKHIIAALALPVLLVSCSEENLESYIKFDVAQKSYTITKESQTVNLTISSPGAWTISSSKDWARPAVKGGSLGRAIKVTVDIDPNTDEQYRTAVVKVTTGGKDIPVTIVQNGLSGSAGSYAEVNEWIFTTLKAQYLWNEEVKKASPDYSLDYQTFLEKLLLGLTNAKDDDGTMDGGIDPGYGRYIYSYIDGPEVATRASSDEFSEPSFGFDFLPMYYDSSKSRVVCLVLWTRENSPASKAGLKRGMWIEKFDDKLLTPNYYNVDFLDAYEYPSVGSTLKVTPEGGTAITMTAETIEQTPIIRSKTLTSSGGKKVAYFMYNEFEVGPETTTSYKFIEDMRTAFGSFGTVDALVLDLRYNGGGYTYCAQVLASLAGNVKKTQIFNEMRRNNGNSDYEYFFEEKNSLKLGKGKLYVLTTERTASSSELVINSLKGVGLDVVKIGEKTEGKNVGMNLYTKTSGGDDYEMWPITFKSFNADKETSSPNGIAPNYLVDDWVYGQTTYDVGDPREAMLKTALDLIDGKTVSTSGTRSGEGKSMQAVTEYPRRKKQLDGIRVFPGEIKDAGRENQ